MTLGKALGITNVEVVKSLNGYLVIDELIETEEGQGFYFTNMPSAESFPLIAKEYELLDVLFRFGIPYLKLSLLNQHDSERAEEIYRSKNSISPFINISCALGLDLEETLEVMDMLVNIIWERKGETT